MSEEKYRPSHRKIVENKGFVSVVATNTQPRRVLRDTLTLTQRCSYT